MSPETETWRRCSSCKTPIDFEAEHYVCSVSTCNRKRTGMVFCSVSCWETHVPVMRHRESWAVEEKSPNRQAWQREQSEASKSSPREKAGSSAGRRTLVRPEAKPAASRHAEIPHDVLIVASKMKQYIRACSGMNVSDNVLEALSDHVRALCDGAMRSAERDGRKTVMARDYPKR
jgi:histone H3/H4